MIKPRSNRKAPKQRRDALNKFYKECFERSDKFCEECGIYLPDFSPVYVSHILARGAYPELAINPLNINILCFKHHQQWEFGNKRLMHIYAKNQTTIHTLHQQTIKEKI